MEEGRSRRWGLRRRPTQYIKFVAIGRGFIFFSSFTATGACRLLLDNFPLTFSLFLDLVFSLRRKGFPFLLLSLLNLYFGLYCLKSYLSLLK